MSTYIQNQKMTLGFAALIARTLEDQVIPQFLQKPYAITLVDEAQKFDPRFDNIIEMGGSMNATRELHKLLSGQYGQEVNVAIRLPALSKALLGSNKINRALKDNDLGIEPDDLEYLANVEIPENSFKQNILDTLATTQTGMQRNILRRKGMRALEENMAFHTRSIGDNFISTQLSLIPFPEDKTTSDGVLLWDAQMYRDDMHHQRIRANMARP